ncbi:hypothetical protein J6590_054215 [Homalodisca vitripennis]|nr:hypothetical protein J6590_054215 [Homalodisca vitripennis]
MAVRPSLCQSDSLFVRLSVRLTLYPHTPHDSLSVRLSVRLTLYPSDTIRQSDSLSVQLSVRPTVCPSDSLSVRHYSSV